MMYVVYNPRGIELGVFDGADADEAIEACCRDAGYASKADMEERLGHPSELEARLFDDDDSDGRKAMITDDMIRELCTITTRDEAGRHFTETSHHWEQLEAAGLIEVFRPTHEATGIPYSQEDWAVNVTDAGQALVETSEHLHPVG